MAGADEEIRTLTRGLDSESSASTNSATSALPGAFGRSRTGTICDLQPLKLVRLPISPRRLQLIGAHRAHIWHSRAESNRHSLIESQVSSPLDDESVKLV